MTTLEKRFEDIFHQPSEATYFSPGRINLIGEHLDYNGGYVLPAAISLGTYGLVRKNNTANFNLYSLNFESEGVYTFNDSTLVYNKNNGWSNYVKGVMHIIKEAYHIPLSQGLDILVSGNIPNGAGLSSSASLELLIGKILNDYYNLNLNMLDLIKIGQQVENQFIGLNSGIMDQFAIGMGKSNHAILLNTDDLKYHHTPLDLKKYQLVIINSNKRRELSDSKYNERRKECETALKQLQEHIDIEQLTDLSPETFDKIAHHITDTTLLRRARHVVYENSRTKSAYDALIHDDIETFGKLMNDSHLSLRDDYEVTGQELDTIYNEANKLPYVGGVRMTGAGFGGCAIALVDKQEVETFKSVLATHYKNIIGYEPSFYPVEIGDGPKQLIGGELQ
ncbi:galactokinase [Macrococcoides bohemicum]|uniref:galactokinase n=1 Tax=Macrococcoides bohemicum TaxID=1903056 RepID=UPI00193FE697|nr:galactokinase [Macrococcus bohemicus]QRN48715.1 galactokinase [Macrococcus bohemicus]QYA44864.1 galactokinase [Macrococcus bohemicus]